MLTTDIALPKKSLRASQKYLLDLRGPEVPPSSPQCMGLVWDLPVWEAQGSGQFRPGRFRPPLPKIQPRRAKAPPQPSAAPPFSSLWSCGLYFKSWFPRG